MQGQGNYSTQVGQGPYAPPTLSSTPPLPLPPPPPRPPISGQPYISHPSIYTNHPLPHPYLSFEQQHLPWSQNVHQNPYSSTSSFFAGGLPPPPPPPSSPPVAPPLPPSSPPSGGLSVNSSKENLPDGDNLLSKCQSPIEPAKDTNVDDASNADSVARSPSDSDMDMEDDITQLDEEKQSFLSTNLNEEHVLLSKDVDAKEQSQHTGVQRLSEDASDGTLLNADSSVSQTQRFGSEIPSGYDNPVTRRINSEVYDSDDNKSPPQDESYNQPIVPEASAATGCDELSGQLVGGASPYKLLQDYASDDENKVENILDGRSPQSIKVGFTDSDAGNIKSNTKIESSRITTEGDNTSFPTAKADEFTDKTHDSEIRLDILQKPDMKSTNVKSNIDEFGRLIREGGCDSDTSDSPRYTRRHARRGRKHSRSRSRSRSPYDRRRRSPRRRKERRRTSRSLSPRRRQSRSRTPILRHSSRDKLRPEKTQIPDCLDFLRGKCYRGASCRYSHHEPHKSRHDDRVKDDKNNKGLKIRQDNQVKDEKASSLLVADVASGNKDSSIPADSSAQCLDNTPRIIDQESKQMDDSLISLSSSPPIPTHYKLDAEKDHIAPITKPYSTEKGPSLFEQAFPQFMPPVAQFPSESQNYSSYQAPVSYQNSNYFEPQNPPINSFLPPPPHTYAPAQNVLPYTSIMPYQTGQYQASYPASSMSNNQLSWVPNFVESRIQNHFNPYASTFDHNQIHSHFNSEPGPPLPPAPAGDQYDPLFDSIEPSSNRQKHEITTNSDNNSFENEEYAEVGAVVNDGETEIDQLEKKKGRDSRSTKLFKVSIAAFVKEVLKPSWRQGNMSKEAFKTIVKKTVDKVSGAMKSHRIPKSQAKVNQYIESSRGKLTKLVMGYVDKYVKV